jgi:hypothetical protein
VRAPPAATIMSLPAIVSLLLLVVLLLSPIYYASHEGPHDLAYWIQQKNDEEALKCIQNQADVDERDEEGRTGLSPLSLSLSFSFSLQLFVFSFS